MSRSIISLENVTKKFGSFHAVKDISFSVKPGEIVGFVGENGAGKTTTINMLLGFTSPTRGSLHLFDKKLKTSRAHLSHRSIGYASGDMVLPPRMTGEQYLGFVMAQSPGSHEKRYAQLVKVFHPQLDKKISTLSRGNRQKIALVAAFVTNPKLVILDEPSSGLDPVMQDAFLSTVRETAASGATIFMSSHYLQEVAEVCSRVLLMKNGVIVEDLSAEQLAIKGGKIVEVISRHKLTLPKDHVVDAISEHRDDSYRTSFGFNGDPATLVKWIGSLTGVVDMNITERTLEQEFRTLYESGEHSNE